MSKKLGVSDDQIAVAVRQIEPVPHRLELIRTETGINILDDSYNSSPEGTVAALDVLKKLKNKTDGQAIVLTCGMVELGKLSKEENFKFGQNIASVADKVIIVNEINKSALRSGLLSRGFSPENIFLAKNLEDAKNIYAPILKKSDILLIENDLPDNFN
jgi:UDP-N-acetylmuramoyl-tripeptide--D-alanyl-D-alanine ligase